MDKSKFESILKIQEYENSLKKIFHRCRYSKNMKEIKTILKVFLKKLKI